MYTYVIKYLYLSIGFFFLACFVSKFVYVNYLFYFYLFSYNAAISRFIFYSTLNFEFFVFSKVLDEIHDNNINHLYYID